jgi:hypothetical protein
MAWRVYTETNSRAANTSLGLISDDLRRLMLTQNALSFEILAQLKLLNARVEEAFETDIERNDV